MQTCIHPVVKQPLSFVFIRDWSRATRAHTLISLRHILKGLEWRYAAFGRW